MSPRRSGKATLERLLSMLHEDAVLERIGLEARLRDVIAELASIDARWADLPKQ